MKCALPVITAMANGFLATHELGHIMYSSSSIYIYTYIYIYIYGRIRWVHWIVLFTTSFG